MKEFIENIIPKLKSLSIQLDKETILKKVHWIMIDESGLREITYIFRDNNELLVSIKGEVTSGTWEYLTAEKLLIRIADKSYLYKNEYFDDKILALKRDGSNLYSVFVNEVFINQENDVLKKVEEYFESKLLDNRNEETIIIQKETTLAKDELSWSTVIGFILLLSTIIILIIYFG